MQSESKIQSECVKWLWNEYPQTRGLFFEIYNNPKNAVHGALRKSMGMIAGVADTCFLWNGQAYFIEFKDVKGKMSKKQTEWSYNVILHDFEYEVIRDLDTFKILIERIINEKTIS